MRLPKNKENVHLHLLSMYFWLQHTMCAPEPTSQCVPFKHGDAFFLPFIMHVHIWFVFLHNRVDWSMPFVFHVQAGCFSVFTLSVSNFS